MITTAPKTNWTQVEQDYVEGLTDPATSKHYLPTLQQLATLYGMPVHRVEDHSKRKAWGLKRQKHQGEISEKLRLAREKKYFEDLDALDFKTLQNIKALVDWCTEKLYTITRGPNGQVLAINLNTDLRPVDVKRIAETALIAKQIADVLRTASHVQAEDSFDKLISFIEKDRAAGRYSDIQEEEDPAPSAQDEPSPKPYPQASALTTRPSAIRHRIVLN